MKTIFKVLITIAVLLVCVFLLLLIMSRAMGFGTIGNMMRHMGVQIGVMWERIFS